ncbi:MAG: hypothetical protein M0D55_12625 [Elusimicrobiota bacterium]|nr:MAG: hypothetical protein M0D55_12625 [Elusimicrobiota bacterium]
MKALFLAALLLAPAGARALAYVSTSTRQRYWSPTFGFGAEVPLNKRVALALDYGQNSEAGDRKVARLSLELKVAVLGGD